MKEPRNLLRIITQLIFKDGKSMLTLVISISAGFIAYIIVNKSFFKNEIIDEKSGYIKIILFVSVLAISILPILIKFLSTDIYSERNRDKDIEFNDIHLYKKMKDENNQTKIVNEQIKEALLKNPDVLNVEKNIYEKIVNNLEGSLINKLDDRFKKNVAAEFISSAIISELLPLTRNTEKYIDRIQRNAIVNLIIGIIGTIISISILAFSILSNQIYTDIDIFFIHFLPRLTFVVFIQLFAFFFLRLYKNNLEDAKYFQNELTNLSAKTSALRIAYITKNDGLIVEMIKELSHTERNFKIQKEETLLNIEKAKIEKDFDLETISAFKDFLKTYKKE
jgi:hypothetical protein